MVPDDNVAIWVFYLLSYRNMKPYLFMIVVIGACCVSLPILAQVTPSFVVPVELPEAGLRIQVPARSVEEPLPPIERRTYRFRQGERTWTEDRYDPREIWLRSQLLGQWRDQHDNRLRILRPTQRLPVFADAHVQHTDYEERVAELPAMDTRTSEDVLAWLADYLQEEPGQVTPMRYVSRPLQAAALIDAQSPRRLVYALRVESARLGLREASDTFVVDVLLSEDADVPRARHSFEERFLRSLVVFAPQQSRAATAGGASSAVASDSEPAAVARSRAEAHASVANLRNWQSVDIGAYVLLSDQRRGANQLMRDLERTLGPMREAYAAMVPPLRPIEAVGIIRIFADQEEYVRYVGEAFSWSAGLWSASRGELVIRPVNMANYQQARERILPTIYHEAFHQYLSLATEPLRVCVWFNEGHAVLFEHTHFRNRNVMFEEYPPYVERATGMPLSQLFALDYDSFYHADARRRNQHYATAWAFVYYLRRSSAADSQFAFAGFLDGYMRGLAETGNGPQAMQRLLAKYDLQALEADFQEFWSSPRRRRDALRAR